MSSNVSINRTILVSTNTIFGKTRQTDRLWKVTLQDLGWLLPLKMMMTSKINMILKFTTTPKFSCGSMHTDVSIINSAKSSNFEFLLGTLPKVLSFVLT